MELSEIILLILNLLQRYNSEEKNISNYENGPSSSHPFISSFKDIRAFFEYGGTQDEIDKIIIKPNEFNSIKCELFFSTKNPNLNVLESEILNQIVSHSDLKKEVKIKSILSYLIGELLCNIIEHSEGTEGYISVTYDLRKGKFFIIIADNGITIPGSYYSKGRPEFRNILGFDSLEALRYSVRGISTKDRPLEESRGYGISTNLNLVVNGLGGEFVILSGDTLFISSTKYEKYIRIPSEYEFPGTVHLISFPNNISQDFDLYKYII